MKRLLIKMGLLLLLIVTGVSFRFGPVAVFPFGAAAVFAQATNSVADEVLTAADKVFRDMKAKDYPAIWQGLTAKSRDEVVTRVRKGASKAGHEFTPEQLAQDFAAGGPQAQAYWDAYLEVFNPDMVLEESTWSMGPVEKNVASVIIQYKKSDNPAIIILRKEDGAWRFGLYETFGPRMWIQ